MSAATAVAVLASAAIGAGTSMYSASEQERLASEQAEKLKQAEAESQAEADRIASLSKPDEEEVSSIGFGTDDGEESGSYSDFSVGKNTTSSLGTSGGSGLGFNT